MDSKEAQLNRQLRWVGHLLHMKEDRIQKAYLLASLIEDDVETCRHLKRFKDQIRRHFAHSAIEESSRQRIASKRDCRRALTKVK